MKLAAIAFAAAFAVGAQAAEPKDLIDARQGAYKVIKYEFADVMAAMVRGKRDFDIERMKQALGRIQTVGGILPEAFAVESTAPNSDARPEIWTDPAGFQAAAMNFGAKMGELAAAVETEDRGQIGAALQAAGQACQACHDDYRAK